MQRAIADLQDNHCPRCLQPVPAKAARCPGCRQPIQTSSRALRLVIGVAGLIALIFAIGLMYQTVREEDAGKNAAPTEEVQKTPRKSCFPHLRPTTAPRKRPSPRRSLRSTRGRLRCAVTGHFADREISSDPAERPSGACHPSTCDEGLLSPTKVRHNGKVIRGNRIISLDVVTEPPPG